jgi:DNA-directed RNA polymerase specialized sigma24 family protein
VVDFVIREHLRKRFGRAPRLSDPAAPKQPSKRDLQTQAGRLDDEHIERSFMRTLGMTAKLTAAEIFAHVARDFAPKEAEAIHMYYAQDRSFEEIAQELGLASAKDADKLVRKLNARLRYRFLADDGSS